MDGRQRTSNSKERAESIKIGFFATTPGGVQWGKGGGKVEGDEKDDREQRINEERNKLRRETQRKKGKRPSDRLGGRKRQEEKPKFSYSYLRPKWSSCGE